MSLYGTELISFAFLCVISCTLVLLRTRAGAVDFPSVASNDHLPNSYVSSLWATAKAGCCFAVPEAASFRLRSAVLGAALAGVVCPRSLQIKSNVCLACLCNSITDKSLRENAAIEACSLPVGFLLLNSIVIVLLWHDINFSGQILSTVLTGILVTCQVVVPASMLQDQVAKLAPEGSPVRMRHTGLSGGQVPSALEYKEQRYTIRDRDAVADVIARMEDSLNTSPKRE